MTFLASNGALSLEGGEIECGVTRFHDLTYMLQKHIEYIHKSDALSSCLQTAETLVRYLGWEDLLEKG